MSHLVHHAARHAYLLAALIVAAVAPLAYLATVALAGDLSIAGLSDDQVRMVGHFGASGTVAAALALALKGRFITAWFITALLAAGDEAMQLAIPGRYATVGDWLIDLAGITTFIVILSIVSCIYPGPARDRSIHTPI